MGGRAVNGLDVYRRFREARYRLWLEDGEIRAAGPAPPSEELKKLVEEHRQGLKAAILLMNPPSWLVHLLNLYKFENHGTSVRRTSPESGKTETYVVKLQLKNIAAAIAVETGLGVEDLERIYPEIKEAIEAWEDGKVVPLRAAGVGR